MDSLRNAIGFISIVFIWASLETSSAILILELWVLQVPGFVLASWLVVFIVFSFVYCGYIFIIRIIVMLIVAVIVIIIPYAQDLRLNS